MPSPRSTATRTLSSRSMSRQISLSSQWPSWPAVGSLPLAAFICRSITQPPSPRRVMWKVW
jgi:hypothetical protein